MTETSLDSLKRLCRDAGADFIRADADSENALVRVRVPVTPTTMQPKEVWLSRRDLLDRCRWG